MTWPRKRKDQPSFVLPLRLPILGHAHNKSPHEEVMGGNDIGDDNDNDVVQKGDDDVVLELEGDT